TRLQTWPSWPEAARFRCFSERTARRRKPQGCRRGRSRTTRTTCRGMTRPGPFAVERGLHRSSRARTRASAYLGIIMRRPPERRIPPSKDVKTCPLAIGMGMILVMRGAEPKVAGDVTPFALHEVDARLRVDYDNTKR